MQKMRRHLVFLIVPFIFLLDRWTKLLVVNGLAFARHYDVTPFFSIVHARNYGGAFSLLSQHAYAKYIFTVIPLLIIGLLIFVIVTYKTQFFKRLSLTCILSGAIGNIYDRISYGYVVDFLDVYYKDYHWPAFNVADISISFGICLWIFMEFFEARLKTKK
ncbi:MAG: signal peptidase II [Proteobacteria bacterium]|nr:signal peptidase II [Pseudomonadota bacterium]